MGESKGKVLNTRRVSGRVATVAATVTEREIRTARKSRFLKETLSFFVFFIRSNKNKIPSVARVESQRDRSRVAYGSKRQMTATAAVREEKLSRSSCHLYRRFP